MDLTVRVDIQVNGLAEEDVDPSYTEKLLSTAASHVQYPSWVDEWKVTRVRALKCFETVREMLLSGMPSVEVARQVHNLNEWKDLKIETVRTYLEHFKATLPKSLMMARMLPEQYIETKKKVDQSLDCIDSLQNLYTLMMKRIEIGMQRETAMQFLMPNMEKQFAVVLDIISKVHDIKKDLSLTEKEVVSEVSRGGAISKVEWGNIYSSPNANAVMNDPESRARLVRFSESVTKIFGKMPADQQQRIIEAAKRKAAEGLKDEDTDRKDQA